MKSRLGTILATTAAIGCAAFLIVGANAQDQGAATSHPSADAQSAPGPRNFASGRGGPGARFSAQDRAAFFDAHVAAVKAGLELTPDQEKLWTPVEQAVRELVNSTIDQRRQIAGQHLNPIARLRVQGGAAVTRGQAMQKLADAAQPLWTSLSEDQKRRLPILMRGMRGRGGGLNRWRRGWGPNGDNGSDQPD